jgi:hypothetical protein
MSRDIEQDLGVLIGRWRMEASFPGEPPDAETVVDWLDGRRFLVQRWRVEHPDAPDGIAVIGPTAADDTRPADPADPPYLQHYFDSRGVARVYGMDLVDGVWTLERMAPGFCQRFRGDLSADGDTIDGAWEFSEDGVLWRHDFDLVYRRASQ